MQLLLLRHANADTQAASDDARALSEKGRAQAKRMGKYCRDHAICPEIILTSPLLRARETAEIVNAELGCELVTEAFLTSGASPTTILDGLRAFRFDSIMIVGHEPDFSQLAASLIGLPDPGALRFRKAALLGLELETLRPECAQLEFLIPVKLV